MHYGASNTIYQLLGMRAEHASEAVAIYAPGRSALTHGGLLSQVDSVVKSLNVRGVHRGDRIAIVLPNGPEMAVAFLGVAASAVCAPLNPAYSANEFEFYLSDLNPKALIIQSGMNSAAITVAAKHCIPVIELIPKPEAAAGIFTLRGNEQPLSSHCGLPQTDDIALILHTSGTTSRPKMVPLTHANLLASARNIVMTLNLSPDDRCLNVMPLFHIHGLVGALLSSTMAGASVVCTVGFDVEQFFSWIEAFGPTWYTAVPTIHHAVLSRAQADPELLRTHSLRFIRSSSSALPVRVMLGLEELFHVPVIEAYGMTEAAHQMASNPIPPGQRKVGSVGRAAGPEVSIMDKGGNPLSPGEVGEIVIRGANVTLGYASNADSNKECFERGWFRTGDQGYIDADGYLFITGRLKEIINRGGEKISPREVEDIILQHPAVAEAIIFAIPHETLGEDASAAVVLRKNVAVTEAELLRFVAAQLAEFKIPRRVLFVDEIPKSATGKPQRVGLAEKLDPLFSKQPNHEYLAPHTEVEKSLAAIWSKVLGVEPIGTQDNFFQLGGDSIRATQVISRVREAMQMELPILSFFETPTVTGLAECIEKSPQAEPRMQSRPMQPVGGDKKVPLSFAQQRLWFLNQLEPANPVYNRPMALRLTGKLQTRFLERCLNEIVRRHEVLRMNFHAINGEPVQIISPSRTVDLSIIDLSYLPDREREAEALRQATRELQQPFDLARGALLRTRLYELNEHDHLLLFVTHHIVFDGWSDSVLLGEIGALYPAMINGNSSPLPDLPMQYADYARWQRQQNEEKTRDTDLPYWKQQLDNTTEPLNLPTDRPRPAVQTFRGARQSFALSPVLSERLKELSRREQVTLFMTLLAAFTTLLCRYTGQEDILVGVPTAGRNRIETEQLLGVFINTVVLRTDLSGDPSFRELLRRVREVALGAYAHQDLPFEKLIEGLQPDRDLSRNSLFDVMFQVRNTPKQKIALPGLRAVCVELDIGVSRFDLTLEVTDEGEGLECRFEYNTDLFEAATIARMANHFQALLEGLVANPDQHIADLPILTKTERRQLVEWNETKRDYAKDKCIHRLFEEQVKRTPEAVAVVFEDRQWTYRELNQRANQLAYYLAKQGVRPETRVGICVERSFEMVVGILGILKAGGAYIPLDPTYPQQRTSFMLEDSHTGVLLTQEKLLAETSLLTVVCLDRDWPEIARESVRNPEVGVRSANIAYMIYTSGSTGTPKGVMVEHRSVVNYLHWFNESPLSKKPGNFPVISKLTVDALLKQLFSPLLRGQPTWLIKDDLINQPILLFQTIGCSAPVSFNCVPSLWNAVIDAIDSKSITIAFDTLSSLLLGGEAPSRQLVERTLTVFPSVDLWNLYGPTEATANAVVAKIIPHGPILIGRPIDNTQVYLLDAHLNPVPIGVSGEIYIGGDGLARGYLNRPELTAEQFTPNPFGVEPGARLYKTGDLARYLADGNIEFLGRIDHQVKIRGFRIELGEIESVLGQHPATRTCVAVVREEVAGDKRLVAYVVPRQESAPAINEFRDFLKQRLPDHMVPSAFVFLDALPLTPNGKVDRKALPVPNQNRPALDSFFVAPRTPAEQTIVEIWAEVLKLKQIGVHDNFFEVGGHSLLAVQVVSRIRNVFHVEIPLRTLFENPTVATLAAQIAPIHGRNAASEKMVEMLADVEFLSDDEVEGVLAEQTRKTI